MRINSNNHITYGRTSAMRSVIPSKKTKYAISEIKKDNLQSQVFNTSNQTSTLSKNEFDSILSQTRSNMYQTRVSIVPADEIKVTSMDTKNLAVNATSINYDKVESIYDVPNAELISRLSEAIDESYSIDTTGMTKAEIYNRIESIFTDHLGKDFLEPAIIYGCGMGTLAPAQNVFPIETYQSIYLDFNNTLYQLGITNETDIIESRGFTGMSENEMRTAVRNKYPDKMTLKQCIFMSYELGRLGLETTDYGGAAVENIFTTLAISSSENPNTSTFAVHAKKVFDTMLEMPADFNSMKKSIESYRGSDGKFFFEYNMTPTKDELLKALLSWFGGKALYGTDMADDLMKMLEDEK